MRTALISLTLLTASGAATNALAGLVTPPEPIAADNGEYTPSRSLSPLVKAVQPAVASIEVEGVVSPRAAQLPPEFQDFFGPLMRDSNPGPRVVRGEGSGFVISADGLLVTNHHVVDQATTIRARFDDGTTVEAKLLGSDARTDIALLQLEGNRDWSYVELGDSDTLQVGDWVVAMGNPLGLGITVTAGIISGTGRSLGNNPYDEFIQTDAAINQGNSGGPLFDLNGHVVGMNSAIIKYANTVGFSIPSSLVQRVVDDLRQGGVVRRGFIGIGLQDPDAQLAEALGLATARGALVTDVQPGMPAERAGLRSGDIVLAVDDLNVSDSSALIRRIGRYQPEDRVKLTVWRDGRERTVRVQLDERPDELAERASPRVAPRPQPPAPLTDLGFRVDPSSQSGAESEPSGGLLVTWVDPSGPAAGRLEVGDRIVSISRQPVRSAAELAEMASVSGDTVLLSVERRDTRRYVAIRRR